MRHPLAVHRLQSWFLQLVGGTFCRNCLAILRNVEHSFQHYVQRAQTVMLDTIAADAAGKVPKTPNSKTFGSKIFLLRKQTGRSQSSMAEKAGLSNGYLADIENGRRPAPPRQTVLRIASALELSPEQCDRLLAIAEAERHAELHDAHLPSAVRALLISLRVAAPMLDDETVSAINVLIKNAEQKNRL